jgi:hypothetical protein
MKSMTRRKFIVGGAAGSMILPRLARALPPTSVFDLYRDYGLNGTGSSDVSSIVQAAIDAASSLGGGLIVAPPGTLFVKALSLPDNVTIAGAGRGATTFKLPNGANTYMFANSSYVRDLSFVNTFGGLRQLTLDGNKANNSSGDIVIGRSWRAEYFEVDFHNGPGHGIHLSNLSNGGIDLVNDIADVNITNCNFLRCVGAAIYGNYSLRIADIHVNHCSIGFCGLGGRHYGIDVQRGAGWRVIECGFFNSGIGELQLAFSGGTIVVGNQFDGTSDMVASGPLNQVNITAPPGGWDNVVITGNVFQTVTESLGNASRWNLLNIIAGANDGIVVSGNSFFSKNIDVTSIAYGGAASTSVGLQAVGNAFSAHAPAPTDPHIVLGGEQPRERRRGGDDMEDHRNH